MRLESFQSDGANLSTNVISYDGTEVRKLFGPPTRLRGGVRPQPSRNNLSYNFINGAQLWPNSIDNQHYSQDLLQMLDGADNVSIAEGEAFDQPCFVLTLRKGALKVWLDIEHGAIIRRSQLLDGAGGSLIQTQAIPRLMEQNGIWFPAETKMELCGRSGGPEELLGLPVCSTTHTVTNLAINSGLTRDDIIIQFPPGVPIRRSYVGGSESFTDLLRDVAPLSIVLVSLAVALWA